jgi:ferrochelatase
MTEQYDAILLVSFGGPEGPDDVMPFLDNVLRGRNVPHERKLEVSEHYQHFGGVSPINEQNRQLIAALESELEKHGPQLPIYWGNRNWHPMLGDTMRQMKEDGVQRALALMTSAFSCYSGCRQYRENVMAAQDAVGEGAPEVDKLRVFFNHPGFIGAMSERVRDALGTFSAATPANTQLVFTAHSIPLGMANGSKYELQLQEASRLVAEALDWSDWRLVYQSRSGPPTQPWLEPDICDYLQQVHDEKVAEQVVIVPIGFVSDHMEVLFDLDTEAKELCDSLSLPMARAATVGTHPLFITALRELIVERMNGAADRPALGPLGPSHDVCPVDCCQSGYAARPARPA